MIKTTEPATLSPESIKKIGRSIGGTHWQADVARHPAMDYSKSMITRVLNGTRKPDRLFADGLREVMLDKIEGVAVMLDAEGLPDYGAPSTKKAKALITEALAMLRSKPGKKR